MAADPPASAPAPTPTPPAPAPAAPRRRGPGLVRLLALVVVLAGAATAVYLLVLRDDEDGSAQERQSTASLAADLKDGSILAGPRQAPFALRYTDDWETIAAESLDSGDPEPIAGIKRKDDTGIMTVAVRGPVRGGVATLQKSLPAELEKRFDDFDLVATRIVEVAAGRALYTSWIRTSTGRVQSNLVVSDGNRRSYSVDAVIQGDAQETAQEVGAIFRTFSIVRR